MNCYWLFDGKIDVECLFHFLAAISWPFHWKMLRLYRWTKTRSREFRKVNTKSPNPPIRFRIDNHARVLQRETLAVNVYTVFLFSICMRRFEVRRRTCYIGSTPVLSISSFPFYKFPLESSHFTATISAGPSPGTAATAAVVRPWHYSSSLRSVAFHDWLWERVYPIR